MKVFAIALTALCLAAAPASAQSDAHAFLSRLYNAYVGTSAKGIHLTRSNLDNYFNEEIEDLGEKHIAAQGDASVFAEADVFVNAQTWNIRDLDIAVEHLRDETWAYVSFRNFGELVFIDMRLERELFGWRIADIYYDGDVSLKVLLESEADEAARRL